MTATIAMSAHTQVSMVPPSLNAEQPLRFLILPRRGGVDKRGIDPTDGHKSLNGLPSSLSPDAAKCLSNGLNRDVLVLFSVSRRRPQTRFARPWRASPTVDLPPLGWRDPASGGLYSDPHGRRRLAESLTVSTPPRSGYDASRGRILSPRWAAVPGTQGFVWLTTSA
jgi:hypothetical protein